MKISARSRLFARIKRITTGVVNAEIVLARPGGQVLVSVTTRTSPKAQKLKRGSPVATLIPSLAVTHD